MITIKGIAELAGVSPTTVSNVINGRDKKMSPETLEKVRAVLAETNYVSNMAGRLLANHGSRIIGLIMLNARRDEKNAIQDPFLSEIIGALEYEIRTAGYFMMLYTAASVEESLRMADAWKVEGLIVLGSNAKDSQKFMRTKKIPLVFIDSYPYDDGLPYVTVGLDDYHGGYIMAQYLAGLGHTRIAFLADAKVPEGVDYERLEGCKAALAEHRIPFHDSDFIHIDSHYKKRHETLCAFVTIRLSTYTALFFASDFYAVDSINLFEDKGIRIPQDISVCGFDDNIYAIQSRPKLTTVHQDVSQKAAHAVQQILRLIRTGDSSPFTVRLPVSLQVRDSVAPA